MNLAAKINTLEGVTATSDGASVSVYGPILDLFWSVSSSNGVAFDIKPDTKSLAMIVRYFEYLDARITALENQGA